LTYEICYNQADWDYRRAEGLNQSSLKKILESPAHYQAALKFKMFPSPAMEIGTALHTLVLDGEKAFDAAYVKKPDSVKLNTKEGKEWKESVGRKKVLTTGGTHDAWNAVQGMAKSLERLEWYSGSDAEYIKRNEVSIYWEHLGVPCKARLDSVLIDEGIVLDLKTTDSAEPDLFTKKVIGLGYDFQAAAYTVAAERAFGKPFRFMFAAVERRAPFTVAIYEADEMMQAEGRRKFDEAIRIYKECKASDNWPGKEITIGSLSYPSWYKPIETPEPIEDVF
jgi:hypothetical protein